MQAFVGLQGCKSCHSDILVDNNIILSEVCYTNFVPPLCQLGKINLLLLLVMLFVCLLGGFSNYANKTNVNRQVSPILIFQAGRRFRQWVNSTLSTLHASLHGMNHKL